MPSEFAFLENYGFAGAVLTLIAIIAGPSLKTWLANRAEASAEDRKRRAALEERQVVAVERFADGLQTLGSALSELVHRVAGIERTNEYLRDGMTTLLERKTNDAPEERVA